MPPMYVEWGEKKVSKWKPSEECGPGLARALGMKDKCSICRGVGHRFRNCPTLKGAGSSQSEKDIEATKRRSRQVPFCMNCFQLGHEAEDCTEAVTWAGRRRGLPNEKHKPTPNLMRTQEELDRAKFLRAKKKVTAVPTPESKPLPDDVVMPETKKKTAERYGKVKIKKKKKKKRKRKPDGVNSSSNSSTKPTKGKTKPPDESVGDQRDELSTNPKGRTVPTKDEPPSKKHKPNKSNGGGASQSTSGLTMLAGYDSSDDSDG